MGPLHPTIREGDLPPGPEAAGDEPAVVTSDGVTVSAPGIGSTSVREGPESEVVQIHPAGPTARPRRPIERRSTEPTSREQIRVRITGMPRRILDLLTAPADSVGDEERRLAARATSIILLLWLPAAYLLAVSVPAAAMPERAGWALGLAAAGTWGACYALSRTSAYQAAFTLFVLLLQGGLWSATFLAETTHTALGFMVATVLGVVFASALSPSHWVLPVGVSNLLVAVSVPLVHPHLTWSDVTAGMVIIGLSTVAILLGSLQRSRTDGVLAARTQALRHSEQRYKVAAEGAKDGLWDWDVVADTAYYSPRFLTLLGLGEGEIEPRLDAWLGLVHPDDLPKLRRELEQHLEDPQDHHFESTHRLRHRNNSYRWFRARGAAVRENGKVVRVAGSLTDATERKQFEERLRYEALHDELTGLPNRVLFLNRVNHSIRRSKRRFARPFAVLFLDLDGFKVVNDSLGHDVGDRLLIEVADRLLECVRPGDTVARLGGDEFTILLEETEDPREAEAVADRIQRELSRPWMLDGHDIVISTSIGIANGSGGSHTPEELIRDADTAMYRAKTEGKAQHRVFDRAMHDTAVARLQLEADLRRAMADDNLDDEFHLVYQPVIRMRDGRLSGFEALLRWDNPQRGIIGPDEFIRIAEETGLIAKVGWWALETAARQALAWQKLTAANPGLRPVTINVNVSGRQMHELELVDKLRALLDDLQLPEDALVLELTESLAMSHRDRIAAIRDLGLALSIDDFGTGYSSLRYLQEFDLDDLKIDKSFVARLAPDGGGEEIVRAIIALAHGLGLSVTAEGVETWFQFSILRALGCDRAQGFYFQKPLPREEAEALYLSRPTW